MGRPYWTKLWPEREKINTRIQEILDAQTEPWGIKVVLVEVKDIDLPPDMQRAMAKQAEAERERRAKVIHAEGEFQASQKLADAAEIIAKHLCRPCTSDSCKVSSRYPRKIIPP